jgi:hypothetical protein
MLSIDIGSIHAIDRECMLMLSISMYAMLSIDDPCYTCYLLMMHSHAIDDACYTYRSMKHTHAVDRWYMLYMLSIDDVCLTLCYRSMMMHHIDLRCMLHMLLIDNVYTHATIDDAWYVCYRSMIHILAINHEARYILQQSLVKSIDLLHDTHTITVYYDM